MYKLAFLLLAGCNAILGIDEPTLGGGPSGADAGVDAPVFYAVTVTKEFGQGAIVSTPAVLDCKPDCTVKTVNVPRGQSLRLVATGAPGWALTAWNGCT